MYLDQVKTTFETLQLVPPQAVRPCTEDEIYQLEQALGLQLPLAYKEFLLWTGHDAGGFLVGLDWRFDQLFGLKEAAIELLEENRSTEVLPEDAFVFFMGQGYHFLYLRTSEGENPPVYEYSEVMEQPAFRLAYQQFSEFVSFHLAASQRHIEETKSLIRELRRSNRSKLAESFIEFECAHGYNPLLFEEESPSLVWLSLHAAVDRLLRLTRLRRE